MTLQELTTAQWTLIDLGSAGRLLPPAAPSEQQTLDELAHSKLSHGIVLTSHQQQQQQQQQGTLSVASLLRELLSKFHGRGAGAVSNEAVAAPTPSGLRWVVAAGDVPGYESVPYAPPEVREDKPTRLGGGGGCADQLAPAGGGGGGFFCRKFVVNVRSGQR
jgi:hypothetical protein